MRIHLLFGSKGLRVFFVLAMLCGRAMGQSASFNFTAAAASVTGWTNVAGDPGTAVRTATASSGITITSVATANWYPDGSSKCANNGSGENSAGFFPAAVLFNTWYQFGTGSAAILNVSKPSLILGGLSKDSVYSIRLSGSWTTAIPSTNNTEPTQYAVMGATNNGIMTINGNFNILDGAVFNNISSDSTGKIRIYVNTASGSDMATLSGLQITTGQPAVANLSLGAGLAQVGTAISLGDSVTGSGPHSFVSNRYQYLGGHQYSFGGSVNDPVNKPVMRLYDNGAVTFGTTFDATVNTAGQPGMRYYPRGSLLQLGATDRLDTSAATILGPGIVINNGLPNKIKGAIYASIIVGDSNTIDSLVPLNWSMLMGENMHLSASVDHSLIVGYGHRLPMDVGNSIISGMGNQLTKATNSVNEISGSNNIGQDTARASLIGGSNNQFGGLFQFAAGVNLINRTPAGTTLGSGNVDFSTLNYTGTTGINTPNLATYPLFVLGNSASATTRSNAVTVMYNGRTQINTTGFTSALTQTAVTPQAALDVVSTNTGVLLPRLTTTQRNAIVSGDLQNGLLLYNTDSSTFQYYTGNAWTSMNAGASARWTFGSGTVSDSLDNVAIGTSNPQGYKLAVNGTAIFTKAVVKPNASWPDYVFRRGYRLRGLDQLASYIRANHHLPGVPGEQEVAKDGIDIGAQQTALLKNVEELTLYLIRENKGLQEQQKQLDEVGDRLDAQQKEIDELKARIGQYKNH